MKNAQLVASAKPGIHEVKTFHCYVKRTGYLRPSVRKCTNIFVYARVRNSPFWEQPTQKAFMNAIFRLAHDRLNEPPEEQAD